MKSNSTRLCHGGLALGLCLVLSSITARCQPTFGGITANSYINLNGFNANFDSFNSADPNHSIWQTGMTWHGMPYGVYSDNLSYSSNSLPSRTSDFTVATDGNIINVGNAQIYGFINTAPGGTATLSKTGSVGDLNWVYGGNTGIEPAHEEDAMTPVFHSKSLPVPITASQTNWWPVPTSPGGSTNIGGVAYSLLITNLAANSNIVYYSIGQLTQSIFINASNVVLYLTNGMDSTGSPQVTLNSNADVSIYSSGNILISAMTNLTENANAFSIYDVAGANLTIGFRGSFGPALVYAPSSSVTFEAGALPIYNFIGAIFCYAISVTGHYSFHYDESLAGESFPSSPWFTQEPPFDIVQVGSNATFSVAAAGPPPITYQWFFSPSLGGGVSNIVVGATNTSLTITNVQPANVGIYTAVGYNPYGSASAPGSLVIYTNAAATLSGMFNTNGQFQLDVVGVTRLNYTVQASTNLTDWVPIWTHSAPFFYTDSNAYPQRYYRAVFVQ